MPTLSTLLKCIPTSSPSCLGSLNPERFTIVQHQPSCAHKLSPVSRIRAAQIIRTGDALFAVEAPLRQCLAQLAPLMLCEREHRGKRGERQLLVLWWLKIMAGKDSEVYWRERVDVFRELGCLGILDGGWGVEVEVDEEEDEEEEDEEGDGLEEIEEDMEEEERRDGPSSTSASNSNSNSAPTTASTATSSSQSIPLASLPTNTSTATAAVAGDNKTSSNIPTVLSRLLTPEQRKEHQAITNPENKPKHPQFPKIGTPMSVARTIIAKHHGLDSNHVLPKLPVQGECGICLYDFRVAGGSDALFAVMFGPTIQDQDQDHEAGTSREGEKKRKREIVQSEVQTQTQTQTQGSEDLWPGYDFTRLIWCKGNCGTSYHKECMGEWIHMMRTAKKPYKPSWPTCPSCRMDWIY